MKTAQHLLTAAPDPQWVAAIEGAKRDTMLWPVEYGLFGRGFPCRLDDRGIFNAREVSRLWTEHRAGRADHRHRRWQLIMLDSVEVGGAKAGPPHSMAR